MTGNKAYFANLGLFRLGLLSRKTKLKIYIMLLRSVMKYGAMTWCRSVVNSQKLKVFERRIYSRVQVGKYGE